MKIMLSGLPSSAHAKINDIKNDNKRHFVIKSMNNRHSGIIQIERTVMWIPQIDGKSKEMFPFQEPPLTLKFLTSINYCFNVVNEKNVCFPRCRLAKTNKLQGDTGQPRCLCKSCGQNVHLFKSDPLFPFCHWNRKYKYPSSFNQQFLITKTTDTAGRFCKEWEICTGWLLL